MTAAAWLDELDPLVAEAVDPVATEVDRAATFPRAAVDALGRAGLLGLVSAAEVGGQGQGLRAASMTVERLARSCGSTAMVVCMHYAAAAVVEALGPRAAREAIAAGRHLTTLAFSEAGSRSHFWTPVSTATRDGGDVRLDAHKSWVTAAGEANSYVWSSRPVGAEGPSTLWLVPADTPGLKVAGPFDGLGLRGNASNPMSAQGVVVPSSAMLGEDGKGDQAMLGIVLPWFVCMSAAMAAGTMEAAIAKTIAHVSAVRLEHLDTRLADLPTIRAYLARMRCTADQARALLLDTLDAIERGRPDTTLRVLEVKAAAGEAAVEVTELAMRVCGGAAFRKEAGVERHFRDARAATVMAPTSDALYDFIGRVVCGMDLFG
ncbi:MAG TPA: acyl-CoA dehydrogenase family protein [Actinomycetes bacterium]|jgi:alkylation response protein AidB-like acyl-CoA dehydrogenase|nr:acyl-CoA dehydrogenase family protein [Actinomycetes bacterium]